MPRQPKNAHYHSKFTGFFEIVDYDHDSGTISFISLGGVQQDSPCSNKKCKKSSVHPIIKRKWSLKEDRCMSSVRTFCAKYLNKLFGTIFITMKLNDLHPNTVKILQPLLLDHVKHHKIRVDQDIEVEEEDQMVVQQKSD
jgi:hypothetical protein